MVGAAATDGLHTPALEIVQFSGKSERQKSGTEAARETFFLFFG